VNAAARASGIKFLDLRCNDAILRGDAETASRLRRWLDHALNRDLAQ
jgi:hypothetical protein